MTEPKEVEAELMEAIERLKGVSAEEQEIACTAFGEKYGPEAAAKARQLLAAAVLERAARITEKLEAAAILPNPAEEAKPVIKEKPSTRRNLGAAPTPKPAPIPKPQPAPRPEEEPKKAAVRRPGVLDKGPITKWPSEWPEAPTPPPGAQGFDRLLYLRGLLGHAVQYVMDTAPLPDRKLALAVSLSACAKGIDRKVIGPSDNSTVLFNQVIAEPEQASITVLVVAGRC
jgi:hypothetical protein